MTASSLSLVRPELRELQPYQPGDPARGCVRLHANELPWPVDVDVEGRELNRYPAPRPGRLLARLGELYEVDESEVLVTRGSDDAIDVLVRAFCSAGTDAVLVSPPTFGMYRVAASLQNAAVIEVPLDPARGYRLDAAAVEAAWTGALKIVFLCSPNNPTGNAPLSSDAILALCARLEGRAIVVVDEAYVEFASWPSLARHVGAQCNLVVLRTLSKAFGLAGARCGALVADRRLVSFLHGLVPPYAMPAPSVSAAMARLEPAAVAETHRRVGQIRGLRDALARSLAEVPGVRDVLASEGNFLLVRVADAEAVRRGCQDGGLLVRRFPNEPSVGDAVRITVGTPAQNEALIAALRRTLNGSS